MLRYEKASILITILIALAFRFMPENFVLMLFKSFAFQFMVLFILVALMWLAFRKWLPALVAMGSAILILPLFVPIWSSGNNENQGLEGERDIRLAQFNVLQYSSNHDSTVAVALKTNADLIAFQEVDGEWADELTNGLKEAYPYHKVVPRPETDGIALFSKAPFKRMKLVEVVEMPYLMGVLSFHGEEFSVFVCHAKAPFTWSYYNLRNHQLEKIAQQVNQVEGAKFLIGDLNTVPWDGALKTFRKDTDLQDGRRSLCPTFPKTFDFGWIPIDHILHSSEYKCVDLRTIDGTASDHMGLIGDYQFRK